MSERTTDIVTIEKLIGPVKEAQLSNTDKFIGDKIAMFIPVLGFCDYAVTALHSHPSYLFILTFNAQVSFEIDNRNVRAKPNNLLALSPRIPHKEVIEDNFPRYIAIFIDKEFFEEQVLKYNLAKPLYFNGDLISTPPNLLNMIKDFILEVDNQIPGSESVILATSLKICHSIIRGKLGISHSNDKITYRWEIAESIEYMHSHLHQKISVEDLAQVVHMSPSHFSKIFKRETGKSCINYLNQIRLERVKRLLLEGNKSITEISIECGFSSPAYLSSSFYNKYKLSPRDFQRLFNKS